MGAGASAGTVEAIKGASADELAKAIGELSPENLAKLKAAVAKKVLIISTSADKMGEHATGVWAEEVCGPYWVFKDAACEVQICSIAGGKIPVDAASMVGDFVTSSVTRFKEKLDVNPMDGTKALADVDCTTFDIVFFAGGHGTCVDFPTDAVGAVASKALAAGKVVGAVCHGVCALVNAKTDGGDPVVKGKNLVCFTDVEEGQVGLTDKVPFLLEAKIKELGATTKNGDPWSDTAVADGKLVTGQNPQSSCSAAKLCLSA